MAMRAGYEEIIPPAPETPVIGYLALFPGWMPNWAISLITIAVGLAVCFVVESIAFRFVSGWAQRSDVVWRSLIPKTRGPLMLTALLAGLAAGASLAPLPESQAKGFREITLLIFIMLVAWVAQTALHIWTTIYLGRFKIDSADNLLARKHVTQTRILCRIAKTLIAIVAISAALMSFESVRQYGVSLLASAGAAGIIVGFALQPLLKNIFAGIQLAITQPIRIDDALLIEGEWGKVEEITSTFVVVRIWDWRRLVVPLNYFLEHPFQNWTKEGAQLIGSVMLYLDYAVPMDKVRAKTKEIVENSPLWDKQVMAVQITDARDTTIELRILVSARDSGRAFDLRCEVREKLIDFLRREYPDALPRFRAEVSSLPLPDRSQPDHSRPERYAPAEG
jgi:small-conductance mechanosensitive channel